MLKIKLSSRFKTDMKKFKHDRIALNNLDAVLQLLVNIKPLPEKYRDHALTGQWNLVRECLIKPDVLLIYQEDKQEQLLILVRIGSHADLFK